MKLVRGKEKKIGCSPGNENEDMLFQKFLETRSVEDRNAIVNKYIYLAEIIAKKFLGRGIEYDDLYQVACIALIKAVERFQLDRGVKFVSFATPTIVGEIKRFFRDKGSLIRIPRRIYETHQRVTQAREYLTQKLQRAPRIEEMAEYLNMSEESILEIIESSNSYNIQSFEQSIYADEDIELQDVLGEEDPSFKTIENRDFIEKSLEKFNDAEKEFIKHRFFNKKTQKEIAEVFKVSQMYVSRLERKVLDKFRLLLNQG